MENKKSILGHFIAIGSGAFLNLVIGLLTSPIITRLVDPSEYGMLSIFNMYANIALLVMCLGLDQALVRYYYVREESEYKAKLLRFAVAAPILIAAVASFVFVILCAFDILHFEFNIYVIVLLCIHVCILILNRFATLVLRLEYKSKTYSMLLVIQKIAFVVIACAGISLVDGNFIYPLIIATMVSFSIPTALAILYKKKLWFNQSVFEIDDKLKKEMIKFGIPFIFSMGLTTLFQALDKISLNWFCDYNEVGIYSSAMTLVHVFAVIQTTFNTLWAPMAMEHYTKNKNDKRFYIKGNNYIAVIMFFIGFSLIFSKDFFVYLLGEKYREAAYLLPFLIFNPIMYTVSESTCVGIAFKKKSTYNIWIGVASCVTNFIGNTVLVPILGGRGAAISTGISYIVFWAMRTVLSNRLFKIDFEISKFILISIYAILFALYSTWHRFDAIIAAMYSIGIVLLIFIYKNTIKELFVSLKQIVDEKLKN